MWLNVCVYFFCLVVFLNIYNSTRKVEQRGHTYTLSHTQTPLHQKWKGGQKQCASTRAATVLNSAVERHLLKTIKGTNRKIGSVLTPPPRRQHQGELVTFPFFHSTSFPLQPFVSVLPTFTGPRKGAREKRCQLCCDISCTLASSLDRCGFPPYGR